MTWYRILFLVTGCAMLGMILGGLPFLQLDRTGIAVLGAIALIGIEALSLEEAAKSIHLPTLILLSCWNVGTRFLPQMCIAVARPCSA